PRRLSELDQLRRHFVFDPEVIAHIVWCDAVLSADRQQLWCGCVSCHPALPRTGIAESELAGIALNFLDKPSGNPSLPHVRKLRMRDCLALEVRLVQRTPDPAAAPLVAMCRKKFSEERSYRSFKARPGFQLLVGLRLTITFATCAARVLFG